MAFTTKNFGEYKVIRAISQDADTTITVPAGYILKDIIIQNTSGITVQIKIGTSGGAGDLVDYSYTSPLKNVNVINQAFDNTYVNKTLYISSPSWGGASVDIFFIIIQYK